ncbi:MAG TPA: DinB family protein [Blastocatellia bacterium]|nr:DinB family protein [Blastocatellia bacterium]
MSFQLDQAVDILSRTPQTLSRLLRGLPDEWVRSNEGEASWSAFDVLGHLIHGEETDWISRARIILEHGESRAFEPFDREGMLEKSIGKSFADLLDDFESLRANNLKALAEMDLTADKLKLRGTHPSLGVVTLEQLLATWVIHDLSHIAQIARVMCKQYDVEVGPWKDFFPILIRE